MPGSVQGVDCNEVDGNTHNIATGGSSLECGGDLANVVCSRVYDDRQYEDGV